MVPSPPRHAPNPSPSDADPAIPYEFRWYQPDGRVTVLTCLAASREQAEDSARRAGWPGHDGTRIGMYRAWLKQALLDDGEAAPDPGTTGLPLSGPVPWAEEEVGADEDWSEEGREE